MEEITSVSASNDRLAVELGEIEQVKVMSVCLVHVYYSTKKTQKNI